MWSASTDGLSVADRLEWYTDLISSSLMPTSLSFDHGAVFRGNAMGLDLGTVQVSQFTFSAHRSRRTHALIRQRDPEQYQLGLIAGERMWLSQNGNDSGPIAGDMVLWDTSRPFEAGGLSDGDLVQAIVLQVPKAALPLRADHVEPLLAHRISASTGAGAILAQLLTTLVAHGPQCRTQDLHGLGESALSLAAACLAQHANAPEDLPEETRTQTLLAQINSFIGRNLGDAELTPRAIATHHNLSLRSLYTLFQGQEESVAASIRRRRLERCCADLANPDLRHHAVGAVAARWGFGHAAAFGRLFRQTYGITPTEYRRQALAASLRRQGAAWAAAPCRGLANRAAHARTSMAKPMNQTPIRATCRTPSMTVDEVDPGQAGRHPFEFPSRPPA
ncbi:helix-turn-helix domain-containing protein [Streptomyces sp. NPDC096339]|uniref:AraC-like ligand-binding domain-containing protein n=1 Tax=Streptomyces sp. NPDC096339 TaxID=3366086 RepID=UPI0038080E17